MKGHLNSLYSFTQPPPITKTNGRIMFVVHPSRPASYRLCIGDAMPISDGQFTANRGRCASDEWDGGWLVICRRPILSNSYCLYEIVYPSFGLMLSVYSLHFFSLHTPMHSVWRWHLDARGYLLLLNVRETLVSAYVYYSIFTAYLLHAIRMLYIFCIHFVSQVVSCSGSGRLFYLFLGSLRFVMHVARKQ